MNDKETYAILCPFCRKMSKKSGLIDSYCDKCQTAIKHYYDVYFKKQTQLTQLSEVVGR